VPVQQIFVPALAALVSPIRNIISRHTLLAPTAQQPGQAGVLGRLSLWLWLEHWYLGRPVGPVVYIRPPAFVVRTYNLLVPISASVVNNARSLGQSTTK
jgi:hypothetical protein